MLRPSTTSISRAQADGQSCGQVEWRISILACWFISNLVTPKYLPAEGFIRQRPCDLLRPHAPPVPAATAKSGAITPKTARYSRHDRLREASTVRLPCRYS